MGRGSSGVGSGGKATNAVAIENMNEAQIDKEIKKAERVIQAAQNTIDRNIRGNATDEALREAFPLGAGGLSRKEAERLTGESTERAVKQAKIVSEAIDKRDTAKSRLERLKSVKKEIHGTGKTLKEKTDSEIKKASQSDRKWSVVQKGGRTNNGYTPRIIKSGDYEIRGSNGFFRVFSSGNMIATATTLSTAKADVNLHEKRKRR